MAFARKYLNGVKELIQRSLMPSGAIVWFNLSTAPDGWVVCNGQTYVDNNGNQKSTPDLIGKYPLGSTRDIGSFVACGLPNIKGHISFGGCYIDGATGALSRSNTNNGHTGGQPTSSPDDFDFDASKYCSVYGRYQSNNELRDKVVPDSVRLLPCMKL